MEQKILWNGKADISDGGGIAFSVVGDHENRPTDMTNIVIVNERYNPTRQSSK